MIRETISDNELLEGFEDGFGVSWIDLDVLSVDPSKFEVSIFCNTVSCNTVSCRYGSRTRGGTVRVLG